jgi:ribosome-binding factor A
MINKNLPYERSERVAGEIQHLVAGLLTNNLTDPRLKGVAITKVNLTRDLRLARINYFMSDTNDEAKAAARKGLASACGFIRRRIGQELSLRYVPDLQFFYDDGIDARERIEDLFKEINGGDNEGL